MLRRAIVSRVSISFSSSSAMSTNVVSPREAPSQQSPLAVIVSVTLLTGIGAGLGAMLLALLLHWIQHVAFGYSLTHVISSESFLTGVTTATPERRVQVLVICGLVAGIGWWTLYR